MHIITSLIFTKVKQMSLPIIFQQKISMKCYLLETPFEPFILSLSTTLYFSRKIAKNQAVSAWSPYHYTPIWTFSIMRTTGSKVSASSLPIFMSIMLVSTHHFAFRGSSVWATSLIIMRVSYKNWRTGLTSSLFPTVTLNFSQDKTSKTLILKILATMMTAY